MNKLLKTTVFISLLLLSSYAYAQSVPADGYGTYTYSNGTKYEGNWKNGKFEGKGKILYNNGASYDGEWSNGLIHGKGTYMWPSGNKYVGCFVNGQREGYGVYTWTTGEVYEGEWANGHKEGKGTYTYADGKKESGLWKNDELVEPDAETLSQSNNIVEMSESSTLVTNAGNLTLVGSLSESNKKVTAFIAYARYETNLLSSADDSASKLCWLPQNGQMLVTGPIDDKAKYTQVIYIGKNIKGYVLTSLLSRVSDYSVAENIAEKNGVNSDFNTAEFVIYNKSVKNVTVEFMDNSYNVKSGGRVVIGGVLPGNYLITATAIGCRPLISSEELSAGSRYLWSFK